MATATIFFDSLNDLKEFVHHNSFTQYTIDGGNNLITIKNASREVAYKCMDRVREIIFESEKEN